MVLKQNVARANSYTEAIKQKSQIPATIIKQQFSCWRMSSSFTRICLEGFLFNFVKHGYGRQPPPVPSAAAGGFPQGPLLLGAIPRSPVFAEVMWWRVILVVAEGGDRQITLDKIQVMYVYLRPSH